MIDLLSYFSFQPELHNWYNKSSGIYYLVCGMVHIKEPLLLMRKSSTCGISLSECSSNNILIGGYDFLGCSHILTIGT